MKWRRFWSRLVKREELRDSVRKPRSAPLRLETLEDRLAPAVIPAPLVDSTPALTVGGAFSPVVSRDPVDPNRVVEAYILPGSTPSVGLAWSTDAGATWTKTIGQFADIDPNTILTANPVAFSQISNLSISWERNETFYLLSSQHDAANFSGELNLSKFSFADNTGPTDSPAAVPGTFSDNVIQSWLGTEPINNPVIAADSNLAAVTDPVTGKSTPLTAQDTLAGKVVYVAWDTSTVGSPLPDGIRIMGSADGGQTWSTPVWVNDPITARVPAPFFITTGPPTAQVIGAPQLLFTQPSIDGSVPGGHLLVGWSASSFSSLSGPSANGIVVDSSQPDGGNAATPAVDSATFTNNTPLNIPDATAVSNSPDTPGVATSSLAVNITDPNFGALTDMDVTVNLRHAHMDEVSIDLISPDGVDVQLLANRTDENGKQPNPNAGLGGGTGLGELLGANNTHVDIGAIFDQESSITINQGSSPFIGRFRPEQTVFGGGGVGLDTYYGRTPNDPTTPLNGTWQLVVVDHHRANSTADTNDFLDSWSINFTSHIDNTNSFGKDISVVPQSPAPGGGPSLGLSTSTNDVYPLKTPAAPNTGVGPTFSLVQDKTNGGFSPFQGRVYLGYTRFSGSLGNGDDTDVALVSSDDSGATWQGQGIINNDSIFDNIDSTGSRAQFMPTLSVDNATGTLLATWYDGRYDASRARVATFLAASIDGGASWSQQVFVNQPKTAFDVITQSSQTLEPIPSNQGQAGVLGFGTQIGLSAFDGHVIDAWAGNLNSTGVSVFTNDASYAAGPRVVGADMGPVVGSFTQPISGKAYNNVAAADGTQELTGFVITFDRPINPSSFLKNNVQLYYHSPTQSPAIKGLLIPTGTPIPLDGNLGFGPHGYGANNGLATQFFIPLVNPSALVGTYSYVINPGTISDRIRRDPGIPAGDFPNPVPNVKDPGNGMDQNANGTTGQLNVDSFAVPTPVNGVPFQRPYLPDTLPLIVPGPHVVSVTVPGYAASPDNLALNGPVSQIRVNFDRNINPASFTKADVIRMIGPSGVVIPGPFTITPIKTGGTLKNPTYRSFLIGFPTQKLSGTYSLVLGPSIRDLNGQALDTNLNAGVYVLQGADPASKTNQVVTETATAPVFLKPNSTTTIPLNVADAFVIKHLSVTLTIKQPKASDLAIVLVAPDGTRIKLFSNFGQGKSPANDLVNTIFDDNASNHIEFGAPPFTATYTPQTPLEVLNGKGSAGLWQLIVTNSSLSDTGRLDLFKLNITTPVPGTGLGEANADNFTAHFRIFNQDPTQALSHSNWTAIGPTLTDPTGTASQTGTQVTVTAVDPSDPSGNTAYVGTAYGGIWKTTNFLTTDPAGPTWIPLTDTAPTGFVPGENGMSIGGLVLIPRNNNPSQTIIIASTGDATTGNQGVGQPGIGFLRSEDGGATWHVIDSTTNFASTGRYLPLDSPARNHAFVGLTFFRVVADPTLQPNGQAILYAAANDVAGVRGGSPGLYKSIDSGKSWFLIKGGEATDVALSYNSTGPDGTVQTIIAGFKNDGVYLSSDQGGNWNQLTGGVGDPFLRDNDVFGGVVPVTVNNPPATPNGNNIGRVTLATPAKTGNPLEDFFYESWIFAAVDGGANPGLYVSKDFGANWTLIRYPDIFVPAPLNFHTGIPTNDETQPVFPDLQMGFRAQSIALDPTNPNIVYLGGNNPISDNGISPGLMRLDITALADPLAMVGYDNSNNDGGVTQGFTTGQATIKPTNPPGGLRQYGVFDTLFPFEFEPGAFLNVSRDPAHPFLSHATLFATGVQSMNNTGDDIHWQYFNYTTDPSNLANLFVNLSTMHDPVTGQTRLLISADNGVYTSVDDGTGTLVSSIGSQQGGFFSGNTVTQPVISNVRNGNLQIEQFNAGAAQPSNLAAEIAGALFYGSTNNEGFPSSDPHILQNGNIFWNPFNNFSSTAPGSTGGGGVGIQTNPQGTLTTGPSGTAAAPGTVWRYRYPNTIADIGSAGDFVQVSIPNTGTFGRTTGLLQAGDNPFLGQGQWPLNGLPTTTIQQNSRLTVDPYDPNTAVVGSSAGRLFRTLDGGFHWFDIGDPATFGNATTLSALAFGAPDPLRKIGPDDFIYVGAGPNIYVSTNGGTFKNISNGLLTIQKAQPNNVEAIVPDPVKGTHDAYAVTDQGVFYAPDVTQANVVWQRISGNIFQLMLNSFGDANQSSHASTPFGLTSLAVDWRNLIPDNPAKPRGPKHPVLYVGGTGAIFRSLDRGKTWTLFPDVLHDQSAGDSGGLPRVQVTQLVLSQGDFNLATDAPNQPNGQDVLVAFTNGRGAFAIRLDSNQVAGPAVVSVKPTALGATTINSVDVTFNGPVDPSTFTPGDVVLRDPSGKVIPVSAVVDVTPTPPAGQGSNHNVYRVFFPAQSAAGAYTITIGPAISDFSGDQMNQTPDGANGDPGADTFTGHFFLKGSPSVPVVFDQLSATGSVVAEYSNGKSAFTRVGFTNLPPTATWTNVHAVDLNGDGLSDYVGMIKETGEWWAAVRTSAGFQVSRWTTWSPFVHYTNILVGDFNGDGKADIAGYDPATGQWTVGLSTGSGFSNSIWATWNPRIHWSNAVAGDFNGDHRMDIAARDPVTGDIQIGFSEGHSFFTKVAGRLNPKAVFSAFLAADFSGDGKADLAAFDAGNGQWNVLVSNGSTFGKPTVWLTWPTDITDVQVGDFNGDGKADLIGRVISNGDVLVGLSGGSSFKSTVWTNLELPSNFINFVVGDFNGDGKDDYAAMSSNNDNWQVGLSTGSSFKNTIWTNWQVGGQVVPWRNVVAGDFSGDGKDDLLGRNPFNGRTLVGRSTGAAFNNASITGPVLFPDHTTWVDALAGDFNGDGKTDFAARILQSGQWFVMTSNGTSGYRTQAFAVWNPDVTWVDVRAGDFNNDGKTDIVGRILQTGQVYVSTSLGLTASTKLWATWNKNIHWSDVHVADFTGDHRDDLVARDPATGNLYVSVSSGILFSQRLWLKGTAVSKGVTNLVVGDFNKDGKADVAGEIAATGQWFIFLSNGRSFHQVFAGTGPAGPLVDVNVGDFNGDGRADIAALDAVHNKWYVLLSKGSSFSSSVWATTSSKSLVDVLVGDFNGDGNDDLFWRYQNTGVIDVALSNGKNHFNISRWDLFSPGAATNSARIGKRA